MLSRMKFEISELVKAILNQVNPSLFESSETTFLDPAMGGGQFIFETIRRLKEEGHSNANIKSRVRGFESNIVRINYVEELYFRLFGEEIPATLSVGGLEELEALKMHFDLVMGNPPYQIKISRTGSKHIYDKFIEVISNLKPEMFCFIIPDNWMIQQNNLGNSVRSNLFSIGLKTVQMNPLNLFGNVTVETCTIFCQKGYNDDVSIILENGAIVNRKRKGSIIPVDDIGRSIIEKVSSEVKEKWKVIHPKEKDDVFYVGPAYRSYGVFTIEPICVFSKDKIKGMIALQVFDNEESAKTVLPFYKTYFESKLIKYVLLITRSSYALDSPQLSFIPKMSMNRTWTDEELYAHFGLTEEEIEYVESQVK